MCHVSIEIYPVMLLQVLVQTLTQCDNIDLACSASVEEKLVVNFIPGHVITSAKIIEHHPLLHQVFIRLKK